ncbi:hypothetical protein SprV_0501809900 [Sparganum proliferum]
MGETICAAFSLIVSADTSSKGFYRKANVASDDAAGPPAYYLSSATYIYFTSSPARSPAPPVKTIIITGPVLEVIGVVLQRLESLVFQHHKPKFWARYVDDTVFVIERDQVLTFKEHLNAVLPGIQFTKEEEENN